MPGGWVRKHGLGGRYWQPTDGFMTLVTWVLTAEDWDELRNPTLVWSMEPPLFQVRPGTPKASKGELLWIAKGGLQARYLSCRLANSQSSEVARQCSMIVIIAVVIDCYHSHFYFLSSNLSTLYHL